MFEKIEKRNGQSVKFKADKMTTAIAKAGAATDEFGNKVAQKLTLKVLSLAQNLIIDRIPTVEEVQDLVEEVLLSSPYRKTARAYIIYREQRARIREISTAASLDLVDQYLAKADWRVNENSNMTFSLQGLNNHISSDITAVYWLNKIYPAEIRDAHLKGDFHIHDLSIFGTYCVGWDLFDLLVRGFGGVSGKVESKPAKHFRAALGQIANFFYTLQGESAGAQAFSNFDTLLSPFVRYDNLSFPQIRQALQEFIFNVNVPTRVGFQCVSEDTEILTPEGWQNYSEIKKGSIIKTFNLKTKRIENQKVTYIFKKKYEGPMYNLKNRIQDQLVSPQHKVVRKKFQTDKYILEPIEEIIKLKSPFIIPIAGKNSNKKAKISNEQIKLMAWIISEGTIERPTKYRCCYRVSIYQSEIANKENYQEIINLLKKFKIKYSENEFSSLGDNVKRMRLNAESSRKIHQWFGTKENVHFIPDILLNLNQEQSRLFLETYLKADGFENCKIATTDPMLLDDLQIMVINAGYGFTTLKRKPTIGKKEIYVLRIVKHQETYIQKVEEVNYKGIIWSPHTKNETIIARRKGKVFITGNTPFTNITLDLTPPKYFLDTAVIIGGKPQKENYKEFQKEMDLINRAFLEVMGEGDGKGRVFTFPIPTYNITKDFDWKNPNVKLLWQVTAKYGIPYFSNFINSDMDPADARSMCCRLRLDNRELRKRGGGLFGANPLTGSIGVVTINMAKLGYLAKDKEEFKKKLSRLMELAKESLEIKRKTLEGFSDNNLYPYSKYYLKSVKEHFGEYWKNHFSTIGLIGMNEACLNLFGKNVGSESGKKFALEILNFMREKLLIFQKETGNNYNLEATPAEGSSYRLAKVDRENYPDIICANEEGGNGNDTEPFYTNSTQLPVNYTDDIFEVLELQDEIQTKYTGGTVIHFYLGERIKDENIVKHLVQKICRNNRLPYFTITPTFSVCPVCGYIPGEHPICPKCSRETEVYSRVVGYLRPVKQWNKGKKTEFVQRKTFKVE